MEFIKNSWVKYILIVAIGGLLVWQIVGNTADANRSSDFTLINQNGEEISLSDYRGKIVILDFWATWCPPCKAEIPGFVTMYDKYRDQGLEIIGVSLDRQGWSEVRPFLKEYRVKYPVVLGNQQITQAYGNIRSIPTTFVIDEEGKIRRKYTGYRGAKVFEQDFLTLIND